MKKKELKKELETLKMLIDFGKVDLNGITRKYNESLLSSVAKPEIYELYLRVTYYEDLAFSFDSEEGKTYTIGYLSRTSKRLSICSNEQYLKSYNFWVEKGCKIRKDNAVHFNGGTYKIKKNGAFERIDIAFARIYLFLNLTACQGCKDDNVIRTEKLKIPVIF